MWDDGLDNGILWCVVSLGLKYEPSCSLKLATVTSSVKEEVVLTL